VGTFSTEDVFKGSRQKKKATLCIGGFQEAEKKAKKISKGLDGSNLDVGNKLHKDTSKILLASQNERQIAHEGRNAWKEPAHRGGKCKLPEGR